MSVLRNPSPVNLFFAIACAPDAPIDELERRIASEYGPIALRREYAFSQTGYYREEMGENLRKRLLILEPLAAPGDLVDAKLHATRLEAHAARPDGRRTLNIDPGYIALPRVVLATGKDFAHRTYLERGVYADLALLYEKGAGFQPLPWTYPDFREPEALEFFNKARELHKRRREAGENHA